MAAAEPYLEGDPRDMFDAWHAELLRCFEETLTFPEIRKGVQALGDAYTRRRAKLRSGDAIFDGAGKRAAFALYYAPLHFLTTWHVVREIGFDEVPFRRLWDFGGGTGAAGAAWSAALMEADVEAEAPSILSIERSAFAMEMAAETWEAFGLKGSGRRIDLAEVSIAARAKGGRWRRPGTGSIPALHAEDALLFAWTLNELEEPVRERFVREIGADAGRPVLILEPVAKGAAPWWGRCERALGEKAFAVHSFEFRRRLELPEWIAKMDKAAGLDHSEITARVLGLLG
jgi:hypothetical protein